MSNLPIEPEQPSAWTFTGRTWFVIIVCGFVLLGMILQATNDTDDHVAECRAMYEETGVGDVTQGQDEVLDLLGADDSDSVYLSESQYVSTCVKEGWYDR